MFMSVVAADRGVVVYPELAGARVLVTGLSPTLGVDLVRAIADHKAHLTVQAAEISPEIDGIAAVLAETASDVHLFTEPLAAGDLAVRFVQRATTAMGGLDALVNLVSIDPSETTHCRSFEDIEELVSDKLLAATLMTRVAANRMRLSLGTGLVLNVVRMPQPATSAEAAVSGIVRAALAAMTRSEARQWAGQAIRINAVGPADRNEPQGQCLTSEPDIAALALYLASRKGRQLSGHVFDAAGVAARGC